MKKMIYKAYILSLMLMGLFTSTVFAEYKTIHSVGEYTLGQEDSIKKAQDGAFAEALRSAAESIGVTVSAYTTTNNLEVTKDEVTIATKHYLKVIEKRFEKVLTESGDIHIRAYLTVSADMDSIYKSLRERQFKDAQDHQIQLSRQTFAYDYGVSLFGHAVYYPSDEALIQTFFWKSKNCTKNKRFDHNNYIKYSILFAHEDGSADDSFIVAKNYIPYIYRKTGSDREILSSMPSNMGTASYDAYVPADKVGSLLQSTQIFLHIYQKKGDTISPIDIEIPSEILQQWKDILSTDAMETWLELQGKSSNSK